MFVSYRDEKIQIVCKYSNCCDMVMVFEKLGGNHIFNVSSPKKLPKDSKKTYEALLSAGQLIDNCGGSDWFGPHKVYAVNNADGDTNNGGFVGGSHNNENNEHYNPPEISVTGRSDNIRIIVDNNVFCKSFEGYADDITVLWDTYVQGCNTKKADGTGREILVEHHKMTYDGEKWLADTDIEFFEDARWDLYFGMQAVNGNNWNGEICYGNSGEWLSIASADTSSGDKMTDTMTMRKNGHYLEMHLDNGFGIGNREYVKDSTQSGAFSRIYAGFGKSYFRLVTSDGIYIPAHSHQKYRGYYRFYYSEDN